jgi:hypothetical protein
MEVVLIFVILVSILLWGVIGSKGHWGLKMMAIFATLMFSLNMARSLDDLRGWPTEQELPEKFLIHWVMVKEPDKSTEDDGGVYIWVQTLSSDENSTLKFFQTDETLEPRAYRMEYSVEMHELALNMKARLLEGRPILGMNEEQFNGENSPDSLLEGLLQDGKKKQIGTIHNEDDSQGLYFYELPPSGAELK